MLFHKKIIFLPPRVLLTPSRKRDFYKTASRHSNIFFLIVFSPLMSYYGFFEIYRVEKNGLQNIAKQDSGRAGQGRAGQNR